jgi:hypothetical protein
MEAGYTGLPAEHREAKESLMRAHERAYPRVREHALVGTRKHFDEPLTAGEREHQSHLRREAGIENAEAERIRRDLDGTSSVARARARHGAGAGAGAAGGAIGSAIGGGGNTLLYAVGLGLILILLYFLLGEGRKGEGGLAKPFSSLVGVATGAAKAFVDPVDPLEKLEGALGAAPISGSASTSSGSSTTSTSSAAGGSSSGPAASSAGAGHARAPSPATAAELTYPSLRRAILAHRLTPRQVTLDLRKLQTGQPGWAR